MFGKPKDAETEPTPLTPEQQAEKIQKRHERKAKAERKRQKGR